MTQLIRQMTCYIEENALSEYSVGVNSKEQFFRLKLEVRNVSFAILASLAVITPNTLFVHLSRWSRSSRFLYKEYPLIYKVRDLYFSANFKV